jgi:hypothetical protein
MTPPSVSQMIYLIDRLRDTSCGGNDAKFAQAQSLYTHIVDKIRNGVTTDIYADINQLLVLFNMSCTNSGSIIYPYVLPDIGGGSSIDVYSILIGNGSSVDYTVTHNLNSNNVHVQVYNNSTGDLVICNVTVLTVNTVKISFYSAPATNSYKVIVIGGISSGVSSTSNIDGGSSSTVYLSSQIINCGGA